jgi:epoxide hydrolase-like predicted phosphatase
MKKILLSIIVSTMTATTLAAAPQAIVFDFGGVLTGEPNREAVVRFIQESFDLSHEEFERINQEKRLAVKQGKTDEEFWLNFAKIKGIALPVDWSHSFKSVMKEAIGVNPQMYALVEELQAAQVPVALLSNIDERLSKLIRDFGLYEPFDPCLLSCEIGIEKPDPKAYEFLLAKLKLPAKEILFIDDRPENVEAAKKIGIDAILFESPEQLRKELLKRGLLKWLRETRK